MAHDSEAIDSEAVSQIDRILCQSDSRADPRRFRLEKFRGTIATKIRRDHTPTLGVQTLSYCVPSTRRVGPSVEQELGRAVMGAIFFVGNIQDFSADRFHSTTSNPLPNVRCGSTE
jgi:hypothetical protein